MNPPAGTGMQLQPIVILMNLIVLSISIYHTGQLVPIYCVSVYLIYSL